MRTCQSCGRENANDVDFCQCGEYLRWEPTNYQMPAVVPQATDDAAVRPPPAPVPEHPEAQSAPSAPARPPAPVPDPPAAQSAPPPPATPRVPRARFVTAPQPAPPQPRTPPAPPRPQPHATQPPPPQPPPPAAAPSPAAEAPSPSAAITLRLPEDEPSGGAGPLGVAVVSGERARVIALVRNQGSIVDNYSLVVHGFPREWYTIMPDKVYLVPFGSAGAYEQEIEIHLHPPRTAEAEARRWELTVGVMSRAHGAEVASAPMTLGIHPYEDYAISVRPQRASGRRRAKYDVTIVNHANAVALLALDAHDSDDECEFTFASDAVELRASETRTVRLRCRPPRQIWLGRPVERRFEIACASGEAGEKLLKTKAAAEQERAGLAGLGGKLPKIPGVSRPDVNMPNVSIGPGGKLNVGMPHVRGPHFQGVNLRRPTLGLKALRMPDHAAAPAVASAPLLPTQGIFRQKGWLPWWLAIVVPLVALLALALFLLLPRNVAVPDVRGSESVFAAEKELIAAGLQLKEKENRPSKEKPGTVLDQSPGPGESVKKGSPVSLEIAVGNGDAIVPKLAGLTLPEADKRLRARGLQKGALSVQPPDLKLKIASTIPAAGDSVKEGTAIDIFYPDPEAAKAADKKGKGGAGAAAGGGGAGAGAKDIEIPKIEPTDQQGYAAVLAKAGLVPGRPERRIDEAPRGTVIGTDPAVGEKVAKGAAVTMLVSAGFPRVAFDDDANVLLASGANGKRITPAIAKSSALEKDPSWSADGKRVVYTAGGQLVSADMVQRKRTPTPLRPAVEKYADPSFAPIATRSVLAVSRVNGKDHDLCIGSLKVDEYKPQCIVDDSFSIGFAHWLPDGKTILAFATGAKGFGIVQYTSKRAFSTQKSDWGKGEFVTGRDGDKGVFDVALSPDGKRLAAIANYDTPAPQLYLTTPDDIQLQKTKPLQVPACKVIWLDSQILALVKLGDTCTQPVGEIVRINVDDPTKASPLATAGDNPTFQPLSAGG